MIPLFNRHSSRGRHPLERRLFYLAIDSITGPPFLLSVLIPPQRMVKGALSAMERLLR